MVWDVRYWGLDVCLAESGCHGLEGRSLWITYRFNSLCCFQGYEAGANCLLRDGDSMNQTERVRKFLWVRSNSRNLAKKSLGFKVLLLRCSSLLSLV